MGKYDPAPTVAAGLIRAARDRAALTQGDLAQLAGITQQTISAYETGRREPTLPTLLRLLAAAGFDLRMRLAPADRHDQSLGEFMDSLPPQRRAEIDTATQRRADAARLRRIRGQ
jgi:hypothetical protein